MTIEKYDIIIIGSGMGGLICGDLLSREGYKVCIIEKNKQIGGCLQTYVRDKVIFDSGVHYLGGLDKGQNLYQVFKYLGIIDKLKIEKMPVDAFDKIATDNDDKEYVFAQGYENFVQKLLTDFPDEEKALRLYCDKIKEVCARFPLYNLRQGGGFSEKSGVMDIDTQTFIDSITDDLKLREVLAGNNMLYAGQGVKTPFYVHAMILNSYIESSWKCVDGGSQIGKWMAKNITGRGGVIKRNCAVKKIVVEDGRVSHVILDDDRFLYANYFISNIHPVKTLEMTETDLIKNVYRNRLKSLENSISTFTLNIILKKDSFRYFQYNYYYFKEGRVWTMGDYTQENWPLGYVIFMAPDKNKEYAVAMTVLAYMRYDEVKQWESTFNTVSEQLNRGTDYDAFKIAKAERLIDRVSEKFPGLRDSIHSYYTSTPLSYRDYIGNDDGSMYGIVKDYKDPYKTFIAARTKLPNLYFTGQNLNLHGILGTTMSGLVTCIEFLGNEDIIEKIKNA